MQNPKSKKIRYLKTLQHLARKYNADLSFDFIWGLQSDVEFWQGGFYSRKTITVEAKTFTQMLQKLHYEVNRKEK